MELVLLLLIAGFQSNVVKVTMAETTPPIPSTSNIIDDNLKDFVQIVNAPEILQNMHALTVQYLCQSSKIVGLEVILDTAKRKNFKAYQTVWSCSAKSEFQKRSARIGLPENILYRRDKYNTISLLANNVKLRVWMLHMEQWKQSPSHSWYDMSFIRKSYRVKTIPPNSRPISPHVCLTFEGEVLRMRGWQGLSKCPAEKDTVYVIKYPVALNGLSYGIHKAFPEYINRGLEKARKASYRHPRFTMSMWVYILDYCLHEQLCGLFHHYTWDGRLLTPAILINKQGYMHVQVIHATGHSQAVLTPFPIPSKQWVQFIFSVDGNKFELSLRYGRYLNETNSTLFVYDDTVVMNDTEGLFSFGGSEMFQSFHGYIGSATMYRNQAHPHHKVPVASLNDAMFELEITQRSGRCHTYTSHVKFREWQVTVLKQRYIEQHSCLSFFAGIQYLLRSKYDSGTSCSLLVLRRSRHHALVNHMVKHMVLSGQDVDYTAIAYAIYENFTAQLDAGLVNIHSSIHLLKQAACYGNHNAMYMLSVIYNNGIWMKADERQSHAYLMLAAIDKHRLSALSLAHKHNYGLDGLPQDKETAYMYYKAVADQTRRDREAHLSDDVLTEMIRLTDEVQLKEQTNEDGDLFIWLKHQAKQGILSAQHHVAKSLFWGSQGLKRNVDAAMEYFRMGAESDDPAAMYDYGIVLYKGPGTEEEKQQGFSYIKRAADLGDPNAQNALGWYALEDDKNYTLAADYFEKSYASQNIDAAHNIGHMILSGRHPRIKKNWVRALGFFEWAAVRDQMDSGTMVAFVNMRGTESRPRNLEIAVEWARYIAEKNPAMGSILRKALTAYREGDIPLSMFYYMLAADTGIEVATFNLAWLCDENKDGLVTYVQKECQWRNFNISTFRQIQFVDSYALIKMGDYYWYGCQGERDDLRASRYYTMAAQKGDPHAVFNLAFMVEEGGKVPDSSWNALEISNEARRDNISLLTELYSRCKESPQSEAYMPCSIALIRVQFSHFWMRYHLWMKLSSMLGIAVVTMTTMSFFYNRYIHFANAHASSV